MCGHCPDEPLRSLAEAQTWDYFDQENDRARHRRFALAVGIALVPGIVAYLALTAIIGWLFAMFVAPAITAAAASMIAKWFPARAIGPELSQAERAKLLGAAP